MAELIVLESHLDRKDIDTGWYKIELPSGRVAEAIAREVKPVILVEFIRSGVLEPQLVGYYMGIVYSIHTYNQVCSEFRTLYSSIRQSNKRLTKNQEEALLESARIVERKRKEVIEVCNHVKTVWWEAYKLPSS